MSESGVGSQGAEPFLFPPEFLQDAYQKVGGSRNAPCAAVRCRHRIWIESDDATYTDDGGPGGRTAARGARDRAKRCERCEGYGRRRRHPLDHDPASAAPASDRDRHLPGGDAGRGRGLLRRSRRNRADRGDHLAPLRPKELDRQRAASQPTHHRDRLADCDRPLPKRGAEDRSGRRDDHPPGRDGPR